MSSGPNHRRGHGRIQGNGPRWENPNPEAGCNSTHVAKARKDWKRIANRAERRTGSYDGIGPSGRRVRPTAEEEEAHMGMYTELRFAARLTEDGVRVVEALLAAQKKKAEDWEAGKSMSSAWDTVMPLVVEVAEKLGVNPSRPKSYLEQRRKDFIPFGAYGNDENHRCEVVDGVWYVCCELKNYTATIESFLGAVLPLLIAEPVEAFSLYEESDRPTTRWVNPDQKEK